MIRQKFYSDLLKKDFNTEKEAVLAEKEYEERLTKIEKQREEERKKLEVLRAERSVRAKEVENAFEDVRKEREKANKILNDFIKDYGTYHSTIVKPIKSTDDLFNRIWNNFFTLI